MADISWLSVMNAQTALPIPVIDMSIFTPLSGWKVTVFTPTVVYV
jgi:hypothetical protein